MYKRTESAKSREDIFFEKKIEKDHQYDTEVYAQDKKIDRLYQFRQENLYSQFEWVMFENKLFNIKK